MHRTSSARVTPISLVWILSKEKQNERTNVGRKTSEKDEKEAEERTTRNKPDLIIAMLTSSKIFLYCFDVSRQATRVMTFFLSLWAVEKGEKRAKHRATKEDNGSSDRKNCSDIKEAEKRNAPVCVLIRSIRCIEQSHRRVNCNTTLAGEWWNALSPPPSRTNTTKQLTETGLRRRSIVWVIMHSFWSKHRGVAAL